MMIHIAKAKIISDKTSVEALLLEKKRQYRRSYRADNSEKIAESKRVYGEKNRTKIAAYNHEYYKQNKSKSINERCRKYHAENREAINARKRKIYADNRDAINSRRRKYVAAHPEIGIAASRRYRKNHPDISAHDRAASHRRAARKRNLESTLTDEQWQKIVAIHFGRCHYCGIKSDKLHQEHKIPVVKGGGYTAENIVPACSRCNQSKHTKDYKKFVKSSKDRLQMELF